MTRKSAVLIVQNHSALPIERLRVVCHFEHVRFAEIRRGVVFVLAAWSGPAVVALERFTRIMSDLPTTGLDLVVLDTDCFDAESEARRKAGKREFCRPSRCSVFMGGRNPALTRWAILCRPSGPCAKDWGKGWWAGFASLVSFVEKHQTSYPCRGPEPADPSTPSGFLSFPT
jgi:hypothetical protein